MAFAYNDVKNYPKKAFFDDSTPVNHVMTDDEMERQARLNTIKMGGAIK